MKRGVGPAVFGQAQHDRIGHLRADTAMVAGVRLVETGPPCGRVVRCVRRAGCYPFAAISLRICVLEMPSVRGM